MHREKIRSEEPKPSEVVKLVDELPEPKAEDIRELKQKLESLNDLPIPDWPAYLRSVREKVDTRQPSITTSHRPVIGWAVVLAKRAIGLLLQPLVNEVLRRQVEFNEAILAAAVQIDDALQQHLRNQGLWNQEIMQRLERLEQGSVRSSTPENG